MNYQCDKCKEIFTTLKHYLHHINMSDTCLIVSSSPEQLCENQNEAEKTEKGEKEKNTKTTNEAEIWKPYQAEKRKGEDINEHHRQTKRQCVYEAEIWKP